VLSAAELFENQNGRQAVEQGRERACDGGKHGFRSVAQAGKCN
jgi:hypothetical protein